MGHVRISKRLFGYDRARTDELLRELERRLDTLRRDGVAARDELDNAITLATFRRSVLEQELETAREEREGLMAAWATIQYAGQDILRRACEEWASKELELIARLTALEVKLGERRACIEAFRLELRGLVERLGVSRGPSRPAEGGDRYGKDLELGSEGRDDGLPSIRFGA